MGGGVRCRFDIHEQDEHDAHAAEHEGLATDALEHEPAEDRADGVEGVLAPRQLEAVARRDARLLVEEGRQRPQRRARHRLRDPRHAHDLRPPPVHTPEAVPVPRPLRHLLLHLVRVDHH